MKSHRAIIGIIAGLLLVGGLIGTAVILENPGVPEDVQMLKKFNSIEEIGEFLRTNSAQEAYGGEILRGDTVMIEEAGMEKSAVAPQAVSDGLPFSDSGDYSTTNVQVVGVDESDFLKNDGKYIYLISGSQLVIVSAYPAESAKIISQTYITGTPRALFINGDQLAVFSTAREEVLVTREGSVAPVPESREITHATVYNLGDRTHPHLFRDVRVTGTFSDARLIGNYVYLVTTDAATWNGHIVAVPGVREGDGAAVVPDIYYAEVPAYWYVYNTIATFDMTKGENDPIDVESFLLGTGCTLYSSKENLFIAYRIPHTPDHRTVSLPVDEFTTEPNEVATERTVIHRFSIHRGDVEYRASGIVPGHLLNQFSMDEYKGNLRVATTVEGWTQSGSYMFNNVYVLDGGMQTIGQLEYLAPDERIYSTRFLGDRLYMVTFKRMDPLFVIDLANPHEPGVLGKLKIPGYSDYLHPYDANHLIGIGKETDANEWGGISVAGVKLAFFDVSDVNHPTMIDKVEIGEAGSDSEALHDHKAFLFDKEKNLLVIPVREVRKVPIAGSMYPSYSQTIWQGAYVFGLTPAEGFVLKGTICHDGAADQYSFWGSPSAVKRSLYIRDVLYTISERNVLMNDMNDISRQIKEIELPSGTIYPPIPYPESVMPGLVK